MRQHYKGAEMALLVQVETEQGEELEHFGLEDLPHDMFPQRREDGYFLLSFIDPYGDTVFNSLQIDTLVQELDTLLNTISDPDQQYALKQIKLLADICQHRIHTYLKFYGD